MTLTEEQLTHLRIQSEYGLSPHKTARLLEHADQLKTINVDLHRRTRIAENLAAQISAPLTALRGLASDHRRGGLSDSEFAASVHYWLDA